MTRPALLALAFALAACGSDGASGETAPVRPDAPAADVDAPAHSLLADSTGYQPVPGPIPSNTDLPDTP